LFGAVDKNVLMCRWLVCGVHGFLVATLRLCLLMRLLQADDIKVMEAKKQSETATLTLLSSMLIAGCHSAPHVC
jgi:hypothetical protein